MPEDKLIDGMMGRQGGFFPPEDKRIVGWLNEAESEGDRVNRDDPSFERVDDMMDYVMGQQVKKASAPYIPQVVINRTKKAILARVSALTDLKPMFGFSTKDVTFDQQAYLLNRYLQAWWVNGYCYVPVGDSIKYASVAGAGDLVVEYDPAFMGGDTHLIARDPRDTLPIRPTREPSLQTWRGLIVRESHTSAALKARWPEYSLHFDALAIRGYVGRLYTRFRRGATKFVSTMSTLDGMKSESRKPAPSNPEVVIRRCFLTDDSINTSTSPQTMGTPGTNWAYVVQPGERLYPQKRLILATSDKVIYDGPSPYWHGLFPVSRLKLESWPWLFLGNPAASDRLPIQDAINSMVNNFLMVFQQAANRGVVYDNKAVPRNFQQRFDIRKPSFKVGLNQSMGEGFKTVDPAQLPPWALEFLIQLVGQFDDLSGVANLQQLLQLRQVPSAETIGKYQEAMTPELRLEARMLEIHLREVAEMVKVNIFQFQGQEKRVQILGAEAGMALEDFDYDPATLVPAMKEGDQGYRKELDAGNPLAQRARYFHRMFKFQIEEESLLAIHAQERQMRDINLSRQGLLDCWTLADTLHLQNFGAPPPIPLPVKSVAGQPAPPVVPGAPPAMEYRVPETITERLMAMQMLGIGMAVNPVGRKASGQEPPKQETKSDGEGGSRTTTTESAKNAPPAGGPPAG
jgi:hypothetical protein